MKMQTAACLAATLLVGLTGCTTPQASTRGQSFDAGHVAHTGHIVNPVPNRNGHVTSIQNYFSDSHNYPSAASYHSPDGFPGYSGFAEHGGGGYGSCPPAGCPSGHCGPGCGNHCPHHYHSYSYDRPAHLAYPDENAVGGAVVYPYYTHKGPSDFFRDDGSVLKR